MCSCPEHTPCAGGLGLPLPRVTPVGRGGLRFPCAVRRQRWHSDLLTPCSAQGLPRGKSLQLCGPSPAKHMQVVVGPPLEGLAQCLAADWARSWGPPSHLPELLSRERGREGSPGAPPRKPLGLTPSEGCPAGTATDLTATRLPRARAVWLRFRARLCSSADAAVAPAATFRRVSAWGRVRACARLSGLCVLLLSRCLRVLDTTAFSPLPGHPPTQISLSRDSRKSRAQKPFQQRYLGVGAGWGGAGAWTWLLRGAAE